MVSFFDTDFQKSDSDSCETSATVRRSRRALETEAFTAGFGVDAAGLQVFEDRLPENKPKGKGPKN